MHVHRNAAGKLPRGKAAAQNGPVDTVVIDRRVLAAAKRACGPEQEVKLRKDGTIDIVNKKHS